MSSNRNGSSWLLWWSVLAIFTYGVSISLFEGDKWTPIETLALGAVTFLTWPLLLGLYVGLTMRALGVEI